MNERSLESIAIQFRIGKIQKNEKIENGLINQSYLLTTSEGRYVAQALNNNLWDARVIEDYASVQSYLRTSGLFVPVLLSSLNGSPAFSHDGALWRCFEYVPHEIINTPTPEIAHEAGALLGRFHSLMAKSSFLPKFTLPGFHDIRKVRQKLRDVASLNHNRKKFNLVREELSFLKQQFEQTYFPRKISPKIVIHGDPKLNNFLFHNNKAIALLDLDTMMRASPLIDIGDALRSWCRQKPASSEFMPEIFESAIKGYFGTAPFRYSIPGVKSAMGLITLELAARYLTDYFEESYFSLKRDKYQTLAEQNIVRCRRYIDYYKNFINYSKPYERDE